MQGRALDEGEEIELMPVSYAESIQMIRDGRIVDGKTIATLLMHELINHKSETRGQMSEGRPTDL